MKIVSYRIQIKLTQDQYFTIINSDTGDFKYTVRSLGAMDLVFDIFGGLVFSVNELKDGTAIDNYVRTCLMVWE